MCSPIRGIQDVVVAQSHEVGRERLLDSLAFQQAQLTAYKMNRKHVDMLPAAESPQATTRRLASRGIPRDVTPTALGGVYDYASFAQWIRMRLSIEDVMSAASPSLQSILNRPPPHWNHRRQFNNDNGTAAASAPRQLQAHAPAQSQAPSNHPLWPLLQQQEQEKFASSTDPNNGLMTVLYNATNNKDDNNGVGFLQSAITTASMIADASAAASPTTTPLPQGDEDSKPAGVSYAAKLPPAAAASTVNESAATNSTVHDAPQQEQTPTIKQPTAQQVAAAAAAAEAASLQEARQLQETPQQLPHESRAEFLRKRNAMYFRRHAAKRRAKTESLRHQVQSLERRNAIVRRQNFQLEQFLARIRLLVAEQENI